MFPRLASDSLTALRETPKEFAPVLAYLLAPVTLIGYVLAFWRLAADLNWAGEFFISGGILSRWQVWLAIAIACHFASNFVNRSNRPALY